ncbi:nucleotidyltransferase family protein [Sulfobacillus harzensis]|uniref:NDP-sugar synthase n=1 Tax=Sulfobacillus harzensis TaxID=2729629 RepID=A0A7Y0L6H9_9FIRM|nr:NDP-sugar synthase [Sulfobacillus harzensis]NMP24141.1 NDP-sugar synthase [Sulfobacillus harzensis]
MNAIILAGGRGSRLDPLTRHLPKPLVPFFGRPLIAHQIHWLASYGIDKIVVSLGHLGPMIEATLGSSMFGARLQYVREDTPLGTAGAAVHALQAVARNRNHPVLIIPGDCLADFDLSHLLDQFHRRPEPFAMVVHGVDDARQFGVVEVKDGRVERLVEKPPAIDGRHLVNTGIYLMTPGAEAEWPQQRPLDFAFDVFPSLIASGTLAAFEEQGYWSDLGTLNQYRQSHFDALLDRVHLGYRLKPGERVTIDHSARIIGPVWLGDDVTIDAHATVGPFAVIGQGSYIGPWSRVENAVIGQGAFLGAGTHIHDASIGDRVAIGGRCRIGSQSAVGADSRIGWGTHVRPGSRLAPLTRISPVASVSSLKMVTGAKEGSMVNS